MLGLKSERRDHGEREERGAKGAEGWGLGERAFFSPQREGFAKGAMPPPQSFF